MSELSAAQRRERLHGDGLLLRTGPFVFRLRSALPGVERGIALLYADYPAPPPGTFADHTVEIVPGQGLRRWWRAQVRFVHDGQSPFDPLPRGHAFPLLEWAMNWCVASQSHHHLLLHAAVIERDGRAVILPAPPGSGKSTLTAALVRRGWRLLSDEMTIIELATRRIVPLCRPVSLKNQSIGLIQAFAPGSVMNELTHDTHKGTVTHLKVDPAQVARMDETAVARWVVFPRWADGEQARWTPRSPAQSLLELGRNAFNYIVLGEVGFETLADVVEACTCLDFRYGRLDDAIAAFDRLASGEAA